MSSSRSSSPGLYENAPKRQKLIKSSSLNTSNNNSLFEDEWKCRRMQRSLATLLNNLSQIEATVKPQTQAKVMPEEEQNIPEDQFQLNEDILHELQEDLETLIARGDEARAAQAAAEAELSQLKTTMAESIGEAVAFLQGETARQKQLFEEKTSSLEKELVHMEWLRQQATLLEKQCRESSSNVQKSKSIETGTLVVSESDYHDLIQENEALKFQLEVLREERDELRGVRKRTTNISMNVEESSSGGDESSSAADDNDGSGGVIERINGEPDLRIWLGGFHGLVSDRKYSKIDWKKEYKTLGRDRARCKKCPLYRARKEVVKDHVWSKHYGGKFHCAYCSDSDVGYSWRTSLQRHVRKAHPSVRGLRNQ